MASTRPGASRPIAYTPFHTPSGLRIRQRMNDLYVKYTGQSLTDIEKALDRDTFLEAEEALKFGIVDKVFAHRPKDEETGEASGTGGAPD